MSHVHIIYLIKFLQSIMCRCGNGTDKSKMTINLYIASKTRLQTVRGIRPSDAKMMINIEETGPIVVEDCKYNCTS